MSRCVAWAAIQPDHKGGLALVAPKDKIKVWSVVMDVVLVCKVGGIKPAVLLAVKGAPAPRLGESVMVRVTRTAGQRAALIIQSTSAEALIDLLYDLDPASAEELHIQWTSEPAQEVA